MNSDDKIKALVNELSATMVRHDLNLEKLATFIQANPQLIFEAWSRKLRHRDYLDHRAVLRRILLRRHLNGETYREICSDIDIPLSRASEIKAQEIERILERLDKNTACVEELAEEYGIATFDITSMRERRNERRELEAARLSEWYSGKGEE